MKHTLTNDQLKEYAGLPKDFSLPILKPHIETAFRKRIYPYISAALLTRLLSSADESELDISFLLLKAAANYTVVNAIPFIKVKFNSSGIDQYEQEKMKSAPWWDVRDLGLASVKVADEAMSDALSAIGKIPELKSICNFYTEFSYDPIPTPEQFNKIYPINKSLDVYLLLVPLMKRVWISSILSKIKGCTLNELRNYPDLYDLLRDALAYSALAYALKLSQFTFISSGVVVQYDELPWQKSLVLSDDAKKNLQSEFSSIASDAIGNIIQYIKEHPDDFPCYQPESMHSNYKVIEKKSGLYL